MSRFRNARLSRFFPRPARNKRSHMAEDKPQAVNPNPVKPRVRPEEATDYAHVPMGEEFSKAKWTLPPVGVVGIALGVIAIVIGIIAFTMRAKPGAAGTIDDVGVAQIDPNSVMVAVQLSLTNIAEKPFWVKNVTAKMQAEDGKEYSDTAASVADFERYFQAFPDLKQHAAADPLKADIKIPRGGSLRGSAIFSFPVSKDSFDKRKSLSITIEPYDQPRSVVVTK